MSHGLRLSSAILLVVALISTRCGSEEREPPREPIEEAPTQEAPSLDSLPLLERLRVQLGVCVAVGGPGAEARARAICQEILDTSDPDDVQARRALGWTDFQAYVLGRVLEPGGDPIPESIANRAEYGFLDDVMAWNHRRWLRDPTDIQRARAAVESMREHMRRLESDSRYRLGDRIRANVAMDPRIRRYNYATCWAPPYLLCGMVQEGPTEWDLLKILDWRQRMAVRAKLRAERDLMRPTLAKMARVLLQLNEEFLRRYGERYDLRPLDAPYGGRPDYPVGTRSYPDGVPLSLLVFQDSDAFQEFHIRWRGGPRWGARSYFAPTTRWVYTLGVHGSNGDLDASVRNVLRLGTYQLLEWYVCQRNAWGSSDSSQDWFSAGLAGYLSGVRVGVDLDLEFTGINTDMLSEAQAVAAALRQEGMAYPLLPLETMTRITRYRDLSSVVEDDGKPFFGAVAKTASIRDVDLYLRQSYMFVLFLQEYDEDRYRAAFDRYFEAYLDRETAFGMAQQVLKRCLRIDAEDWPRLDAEFRAFVDDDLLQR